MSPNAVSTMTSIGGTWRNPRIKAETWSTKQGNISATWSEVKIVQDEANQRIEEMERELIESNRRISILTDHVKQLMMAQTIPPSTEKFVGIYVAGFFNKTKNNIVIMGKNTYFSLPEGSRPLKERLNKSLIALVGTHASSCSDQIILENDFVFQPFP